ncbi:phosphopantetheine-binding protein [Streptomyces cyaneus]|uniref:phosphopantetheine-binding protein n=1 Tax=Streptomyces cyaneus TaxID=1904 RepID=UPI000FF88920|nr:phosphopantetheine-binding protein [Streptomyces cyaneus]
MTNAVGGPPKRMPTHIIESMMCSLWGEHFGHPVGPDDDFFELGGDSLAILEIVLQARKLGLELRASQALRHPTPARLAESITVRSLDRAPERLLSLVSAAAHTKWPEIALATRSSTVSALTSDEGYGSPLVVIHSDSHRVAEQTALLRWELGRPIHSLHLPGLDGSVTDGAGIVALSYVLAEAVNAKQLGEPVSIAGFGIGAVFAHEVARALQAAGRQVDLLALVSPSLPGVAVPPRDALLRERVAVLGGRFGLGDGADGRDLLHQAHAAGWFEDVESPEELVHRQATWVELTSAVAERQFDGFHRYDGPSLLAADGARQVVAEKAWGPGLTSMEVCQLDHGLESPAGALRDPRLADALRKGRV